MPVTSPALLSVRAARAIAGGLSESTVRRLIAAGSFPKPIVLSRCKDGHPARIAFVEAEVRDWVSRTIKRARGGDAPLAPRAEARG